MKNTNEITENLYRINDYRRCHVNKRAKENPKKYLDEWERRYESVLKYIAKNAVDNDDIRILLLAGPSSSGKTTTAHKIAEQVEALGEKAFVISGDDFYLNRKDIPLLPNGNPDFENIESLDLKLLKKCLSEIAEKGETIVPHYDMATEKRIIDAEKITLSNKGVVIVEGLHCLNPIISGMIPGENCYKIYISVMSNFTDDDRNIILSKKDIRFLRRMVRDYTFRNSSVEFTFKLWDDVCKGEKLYIDPYIELADIYINSASPLDPCVLKEKAESLLKTVQPEAAHYEKCVYLKNQLDKFQEVRADNVWEKSVLREFIGGSHFSK